MRKATLSNPPRFTVTKQDGGCVTLSSDTGAVAHVFVLEDDIIRVLMLAEGDVKSAPSWAVAPGAADIAEPGRDRMSTEGFSCPDTYHLFMGDDSVIIETSALRLSIDSVGFRCTWEQMIDGSWHHMMSDRPTQSYNFGWWDDQIHHYIARRKGERYYGLGERSGAMDRAGRRFRFNNLDPMGYDSETSDPLYKTIPYILVADQDDACFGMFYDNMGEMVIDLGQEMDNYHEHFRSMVASSGDLDLYVIAGPKPLDVTKRFTWMTGKPTLMPHWSLGYSGSTMTYTDAPNAQERQNEFLEKLEEHEIGCTSFHLSSGYTSIGAKRYVFNWNREKFPDPAAFVDTYRDAGLELVPNIKPAFLRDHPRYEELADAGYFVSDADGNIVEIQFWDELGALIDFTKPEAAAWWRKQVKEALLDFGMRSTWNDNNEFGIWDSTAKFDCFGAPRPASEMRPVQALLMSRASRRAQMEQEPNVWPYVVTRSGMTGLHRYAQTWSGDNLTEWKTIRFNAKMGLGLALSGVSNSGHDIGGFAGPRPSPELFVRWVQAGVLMPRFSIHSWNDDGSVNEPWMYTEELPTIKRLLALRETLMPYLYDMLWQYHTDYEPMVRPLWLDHPSSSSAWADSDAHLLGKNLLVVLACEQGVDHVHVALPADTSWTDFTSGKQYQGGADAVLPAPLDGLPPMLAKNGSAIPVDLGDRPSKTVGQIRGLYLFPPHENMTFEWSFQESTGDEMGRTGTLWSGTCTVSGDCVSVVVKRGGEQMSADSESLTVLLPVNDGRRLESTNAQAEPISLNGQTGLRIAAG